MARGRGAGLPATASLFESWANAKRLPESQPARSGGQANSLGQRLIQCAGFAHQVLRVCRKLLAAPCAVLGASPEIDEFRACSAGQRKRLLLCGDQRLGDVIIEQNAVLGNILVEEAHVCEPY